MDFEFYVFSVLIVSKICPCLKDHICSEHLGFAFSEQVRIERSVPLKNI